MDNYINEYILQLKNDDIEDFLYKLGTEYNYVYLNSGQVILKNDTIEVNCGKRYVPVYRFLVDNSYLNLEGKLENKGKQYFQDAYVYEDKDSAKQMIYNDILKNSVVNLIVQVFYGRGKITKKALCNLLNFHHISSNCLNETDISSLLVLLNKYNILIYDKRNNMFSINDMVDKSTEVIHYYVEPSTPFSNLYNMKKILRMCKGDVYWVDKHFRKEGFEVIIDGISAEGVKSFKIISSPANVTKSAYEEYILLKEELGNRNIVLEWHIIDNPKFKWHDRWILSDSVKYNIPPVLAIIRGQRSEMLKTESQIEVLEFMQNTIRIEDYDK